jgi:hypothetical protein
MSNLNIDFSSNKQNINFNTFTSNNIEITSDFISLNQKRPNTNIINSNIENNTTYSNTNFQNIDNFSNVGKLDNKYVPDHKHYPANFDMLFDTALIQTSQLELLEVPKKQEVQNKKDHFDFVNELMKKKKF